LNNHIHWLWCSNEKKRFEIQTKLAQLYYSGNQHQLAVSTCEQLLTSSAWVESEGLPVFRVLAASIQLSENVPEKQIELVSKYLIVS
jgi:hypothetical protein